MTDIAPTTDFLTTADNAEHPSLPPLVMERGKDLSALLDLLNAQQAVKYDVVAAADRLRYEDGQLVVADALDDLDNVTIDPETNSVTAGKRDLHLAPTAIFEDQIATALDIPARYVRKMRAAGNADEFAVALLDRNVNHWLDANPSRLFTVRGFYNPTTGDGIARAIVSGRYELLDNLDALAAVLGGIGKVAESRPDIDPGSLKWKVDVTERNMRVRMIAPQVAILAPEILGDYRDPWGGTYSGSTGSTPPVIEAGLDIRNSETGGGAWMIVPFLHVLICSNGLTRTQDAIRRAHIGAEKMEGRIIYSVETQRKALDLITSQTADAVAQYLSEDWLHAAVESIKAEAQVKVDDAKGTLEHVAKTHKIPDGERDSIFETFLRAGQDTAGGVAQAITAFAHTVSPTRAMELDDLALAAMTTAAKYASTN